MNYIVKVRLKKQTKLNGFSKLHGNSNYYLDSGDFFKPK